MVLNDHLVFFKIFSVPELSHIEVAVSTIIKNIKTERTIQTMNILQSPSPSIFI